MHERDQVRVASAIAPIELLRHELGDVLARLGRLSSRAALDQDTAYQAHRDEIERVLHGYEWSLGRARQGSGPLRAVAWNIERGKELPAIDTLLRDNPVLAGADLVLLNEVDIGMARSGNVDVATALADSLGLDLVFANSHVVLSPGDIVEREQRLGNRWALHGNALLTRLAVRRWTSVRLPEWRDRMTATERRLGDKRALLVEVEHDDGPLCVVVTHLDPFAPPIHRARQMQRLVARAVAFSRAPILLGGDFNTTTWDLGGPAAIGGDLLRKGLVHGVARTVDDYLWPERTRESEVFATLARAGFSLGGFNRRGIGTIEFDCNDPRIELRALEYMPHWLWERCRRLLDPWGGVVPLHIDWFAGRGLEAIEAEVVHRPTIDGVRPSDHDPIALTFSIARARV